MVDALTLLVSKRSECGVLDTNEFWFARVTTEALTLLGPMQILNLKNDVVDQVTNLLGHDIHIYRDDYSPEATSGLAKISTFLLAMEKGRFPNIQCHMMTLRLKVYPSVGG
ncbi:hypothetical protein F2P79_014434 [Pimephales promelas]|nr:hypothetical protein F2P79_014434 [Pimephales promelas]